jgi:hypothetical protein
MKTLIQIPIPSFLIVPILALACIIGLLPNAEAVIPAPDGGYAGGNTAEGQNALLSRTTGGFNAAVGFLSLRSDTTGSFNTAIGAGTLLANTADQNTATGAGALLSNTTGFDNTADGAFALFGNTDGMFNTATGFEALFTNTTGIENTAVGVDALSRNTGGDFNTAVGVGALSGNIAGQFNTAVGEGALSNNATASNNTAVGADALSHTTGANNIALGYLAGLNQDSGSNNIYIGDYGSAGESNVIAIGVNPGAHTNTYIDGIYGVTTALSAIPVLIGSDGQLGTVSSSRRFKKDIRPMDKASEAILTLKPVTFHYKSDKTNRPEFGLIAEEVEKVNPDLVVRDKEGKPYSVRYDQVNAMVLNEFLKVHKAFLEEQQRAQQLEAKVTKQQKDSEASDTIQRDQIQALAARLDKQAAQIQRMSAQLEVSKPAPQTVLNNR